MLDIMPALCRARHTCLTDRSGLTVMRTGEPWASVGIVLVFGLLVGPSIVDIVIIFLLSLVIGVVRSAGSERASGYEDDTRAEVS